MIFDLISNGDIDGVRQFLSKKPEAVHLINEKGFTTLILASYFNNVEMTKVLIDAGADVNVKATAENTALMGVCFKGNIPLAQLLIDAGANINEVNAQGHSALIFASMFGQEEMVKFLLQNGADKTIKDLSGQDALSHAISKEFQLIVKLLK